MREDARDTRYNERAQVKRALLKKLEIVGWSLLLASFGLALLAVVRWLIATVKA